MPNNHLPCMHGFSHSELLFFSYTEPFSVTCATVNNKRPFVVRVNKIHNKRHRTFTFVGASFHQTMVSVHVSYYSRRNLSGKFNFSQVTAHPYERWGSLHGWTTRVLYLDLKSMIK